MIDGSNRDISAENIISCFDGPTAALTQDGTIAAVNEEWKRFASCNGGDQTTAYLAKNYLEICESAAGPGSEEARDVAAGIRAILSGESASYQKTYPCHAPTERRWYKCLVRPIRSKDHVTGAVIQHVNATDEVEGKVTNAARVEMFGLAAAGVGAYAWEWDFIRDEIHPTPSLRSLLGLQIPVPWSYATFERYIHLEDRALIRAQSEKVKHRQLPALEIEHRIQDAKGRVIWLKSTGVAHRDAQGTPERMIGFSLDITKSKETDLKMRAALQDARQLALVADKTDNPVIITDAKGRVEWVNPSFTTFTGWDLNTVIGQKPGDFLRGPATNKATCRLMTADIMNHRPHISEILNYRRDGTPFWIEIDIQPVTPDRGEPTRFIAIQRDVTRIVGVRAVEATRVKALEALARDGETSEVLASTETALSDSLQTPIPESRSHLFLLDRPDNGSASWQPVQSSSLAHALFEAFPEDEALTAFKRSVLRDRVCKWLDLHADGRSPDLKTWATQNAIRSLWAITVPGSGDAPPAALVLTTPDRTEPTAEDVGTLQEAADMISDILDRARAVSDKHQFMNRIALLAKALPVRVVFLDRDNVIRFANESYAQFLDKTVESLIGNDLSTVLSPDAWSVIELPLSQAFSGDATHQEMTIPYHPEKVRDVRVTYIPEHLSDGTVRGVYVVMEDLTEFRDRERKLSQAIDEAKSANETKTRFLANMSHELRTPLNAIIGYSETILSGLFGEIGNARYKEYVKDIHESGAFLLELIEGVLELSRIDHTAPNMTISTCDVNKVIREALTFHLEARQKVSLDLNVPSHICADERALKQIILNLVTNAIRHGDDAPVRVSTRCSQDGWIQIVVEDRGPGIPPEDLERVTEPFFTANTSPYKSNTNSSGAGIGLAIVKRLIHEMGGSLYIESEVSQFTRVTIKLPQAPL